MPWENDHDGTPSYFRYSTTSLSRSYEQVGLFCTCKSRDSNPCRQRAGFPSNSLDLCKACNDMCWRYYRDSNSWLPIKTVETSWMKNKKRNSDKRVKNCFSYFSENCSPGSSGRIFFGGAKDETFILRNRNFPGKTETCPKSREKKIGSLTKKNFCRKS